MSTRCEADFARVTPLLICTPLKMETINYVISKEVAKKVFNTRLSYIIPAAIFGISIVIIQFREDLNDDYFIKIVLPFLIIVSSLVILLGVKQGINRMTGTQIILNDEHLTIRSKSSKTIILNLVDIIVINENRFGLLIKDLKNKVTIPKEVKCYDELKKCLRKE